jgi:hypothetical protein
MEPKTLHSEAELNAGRAAPVEPPSGGEAPPSTGRGGAGGRPVSRGLNPSKTVSATRCPRDPFPRRASAYFLSRCGDDLVLSD